MSFRHSQQLLPASSFPDFLCWNLYSKGLFSVKSSYSILTHNSIGIIPWPLKPILKGLAPLKVKCFTWLVLKGACLKQSNLQRRDIQLCNRCILWRAAWGHQPSNSTVYSLLKFRILFWTSWACLVYARNNTSPFGRLPQDSYTKGFGYHLVYTISAAVWWCIWKESNNRVFKDRKDSYQHQTQMYFLA